MNINKIKEHLDVLEEAYKKIDQNDDQLNHSFQATLTRNDPISAASNDPLYDCILLSYTDYHQKYQAKY